ncbi:MAG: DUF3159 domain-containing protein [Jatrophihabitantaceae bacterium]
MNSPAANELRERTRQQLLDSFGGWSGTVISALPLVVFVAVNASAGLWPAIWAAVVVAVLLAGYRLVRRQSVQQAATGLFSVLVAAAIAAHTGQARGFFLLGIAGSIFYGAIFAITLIIRRPLVGLLWEFLDPAPLAEGERWHRVTVLRRAYDLATLAGLAMFAARAVVQLSLFRDDRTGWLAVTRIVMGFPLYLVVLAFGIWVVRRARQRLPRPEPAELPGASAGAEAGAEPGSNPAAAAAEPPAAEERPAD